VKDILTPAHKVALDGSVVIEGAVLTVSVAEVEVTGEHNCR